MFHKQRRLTPCLGGAGFLFGGTVGILRDMPPFLSASASGLQTFALGTSFWAVRSGVLQMWTPEQHTPANCIKASTFSGGLTAGMVALVARGRANALPGAVMGSVSGCLGQWIVNRYNFACLEPPAEQRDPLWRRMFNSSWSPVKVLNDEEYLHKLREKMLKVDVEIALIDDKIEALRQEPQLVETQKPVPTSKS